MTLEQWMALPSEAARRVLFEALHDRLATFPLPAPLGAGSVPPTRPPSTGRSPNSRPPRFDTKLPRRGGFQWASETELPSLEWFREKKLETAAGGGPYAEKDGKLAAELAIWIAWRRVAPSEPWRGARTRQNVTALPPSRDPVIHPWQSRGPTKLEIREDDHEPRGRGGFDDRDYGAGAEDLEGVF